MTTYADPPPTGTAAGDPGAGPELAAVLEPVTAPDPAAVPAPAVPPESAAVLDPVPAADGGELAVRMAGLRERVAALVEARSAGDPTAADPLRGMYLSSEGVAHLLATAREPAPAPAASRARGDVLDRLAARCGLGELDVDVLLVALAPELDRRFEQFYGYLNDDVSRRRATAGLALDLCGLPATSVAGRARLHPHAPLRAAGLLTVEAEDRPFLSRTLGVPDRVVAHLLGDDTPDPALGPAVRLLPCPTGTAPAFDPGVGPLAGPLRARLADGPLLAHLREARPDTAVPAAVAALHSAGLDALHLAPPRLGERSAPVSELLREARLRGAGIVVGPLSGELPDTTAELVRALARTDVSVLFCGSAPADPEWTEGHLLQLDVAVADVPAEERWSAALPPSVRPGFDLAATVAPYRLAPEQIGRAARDAVAAAAFEGVPLRAAHLQRAALAQSASGLERHARRIQPAVGWDDLLLPAGELTQVRELVQRARHRSRVLGSWGLRAGGGRGHGVVALFAGQSGTGKTLAAEVVAAELGLDLYVVQLPAVVDKYIGETEKNLERIFTEADRVDAVLLFDEADAVFGKRSEVKNSHDRYANLESAYLLQRLESFAGIALLTTNLRSNIDEAFTRRLDLVVDFPFPDAGQRHALWRHSLTRVPCAPEAVDQLEALAAEFELAGGSVRSAVVTAAFLAAARGDAVTGADLLEGARREYRKAGRLVLADGPVSW